MASHSRLAVQRRLETSATTTRVVGVACLALGVIALCLLGNMMRFGGSALEILFFFVPLVVAFYGPAALYLAFASRIRNGVQWVIITTLVIASLHALLILAALVVYVLVFFVLGVIVAGILFLLLVLLIVHCALAIPAARETAAPHGFEPLMPQSPGMWQAPTQPPPAEDDGGWPDIR
jgi:hypothetical protein